MFLVVRLWPVWPARRRGCDAYYFLLTAEAFRGRRRLPIELPPYFLLEQPVQHYPPGFSVMLGLLPPRWLARRYWLLNHLFDGLIALGLTWWCADRYGAGWGFAAGVAYAISPFVVLEFASLTARAPAMVMFVAFLVTGWLWLHGSPALLAAAVAIGVVILYLHKLTVQLLWCLVPVLAVAERDWRWLVPLAAAYTIAFAVSPRLFVGMQRAHADIVAFWARNWRFLGSHQVRNSPVYGDGAHGTGYHRGEGLGAVVVHLRRVLQYSPWVVVPAVLLVHGVALSDAERFCAAWVVGTYLWAFVTLVVPWAKGLGEGTKYVKYALVPTLVLVVAVLTRRPPPWAWALAALAAAATVWGYAFVVRELRGAGQAAGVVDDHLEHVLARVATMEGARLLCLPTHVADLVAYRTRRPVLWGTHHPTFRDVEPFYPVLRRPIEDFVQRYGLTHMLLDTRFADPDELRIASVPCVHEDGPYRLYSFIAGQVDAR